MIGALLGLLCAAGLFFASRASFKAVGPDAPERGLALVALSLFGRLALVTFGLWAYKNVAPSGFKPFAITLAGGFLVLYTIELVRYAGLHKVRRPAGTRQ